MVHLRWKEVRRVLYAPKVNIEVQVMLRLLVVLLVVRELSLVQLDQRLVRHVLMVNLR